ncbi:immunoglobulin-binding protein, partial [Escherichia coli]
MLKRRDAFLKKSALAVSMALLLSTQAQAQAQAQAHILYGSLDFNEHGSLMVGDNSFILNSAGNNVDSILIGRNAASFDSNHSIQIGGFTDILDSLGSITIGKDSGQLNSKYGIAIGKSVNLEDSERSIGIGGFTNVLGAVGSVALGHGSAVVGEDNVVSVGSGIAGSNSSFPETRRIINVTDGINDTDAATVGQVKKVQSEVDKLQGDLLETTVDLAASISETTESRVSEVRKELKAEGDSLRGEIGGVYRDARAHTDSQVTAVRDELSRDIIAGTSAAVAYTDASSLALQDEIKEKADETVQVSRAYTDKSVRDARKEAKSQAEHLSDVLVKNRAQTDAAIASNTAAIRNNSHRLDLT